MAWRSRQSESRAVAIDVVARQVDLRRARGPSDPPTGDSQFVTYEGLPTDHYLKLVGEATQMLRGQRDVTDTMPEELTPRFHTH